MHSMHFGLILRLSLKTKLETQPKAKVIQAFQINIMPRLENAESMLHNRHPYSEHSQTHLL